MYSNTTPEELQREYEDLYDRLPARDAKFLMSIWYLWRNSELKNNQLRADLNKIKMVVNSIGEQK